MCKRLILKQDYDFAGDYNCRYILNIFLKNVILMAVITVAIY